MGFQSSFNQALGTLAGAFLGAKHIKGQKESIAEQKMQGKFNVEREANREIEQNSIADYNAQNGTAFSNINEMMAARAGQALANETISKKSTSEAVREPNRGAWMKQYMDWYGVGVYEATKAYNKEHDVKAPNFKKEEEGGKE